MNIRRLVPTDASVYRAMMLEAYTCHPDAFTSDVDERQMLPLSWWESRLGDDLLSADIVLGAFKDHRMAGVAGLSFDKRAKAKHKATLFGMYVASEFRNNGIARQLVVAILKYAESRDGIKLVQLTVTNGNTAAQTLYEDCGFEQFGLEPFAVAVGSGFVSKVHMWCNLGLR